MEKTSESTTNLRNHWSLYDDSGQLYLNSSHPLKIQAYFSWKFFSVPDPSKTEIHLTSSRLVDRQCRELNQKNIVKTLIDLHLTMFLSSEMLLLNVNLLPLQVSHRLNLRQLLDLCI